MTIISHRFNGKEAAIEKGEYQNTSSIYGRLKQISNEISGTELATRAQALLDERF